MAMAMAMLLSRKSIGKALFCRTLVGDISRFSTCKSYPRTLVGDVSRFSTWNSYPRDSEDYFVNLLNKKIKITEGPSAPYSVNPGRIHASLIKNGISSDRVLYRMLRLYGSCGSYIVETDRFFNETKGAGLCVWNAYIYSLGCTKSQVLKAIQVFEDIPKTMVKTHATYWNVMVACSHGGQTSYAHYLLGKFYKLLAIEPTIELAGTYVDGLARKGQLDEAFMEVKCLIYKPNQQIFASLLSRFDMHPEPVMYANEILSYAESKGVVFYIAKPTYQKLADSGVKLNSSLKILKERKGVSTIRSHGNS